MKGIFKKPVAVILALLVVLGSISVAVFADPHYTGSISSATKFYKVDADYKDLSPVVGAKDGELEVKTGDHVKAVFYFGSTYYVGKMNLDLIYDSDILTVADNKKTEQYNYNKSGATVANTDDFTVTDYMMDADNSFEIELTDNTTALTNIYGYSKSQSDGKGVISARLATGLVTAYDINKKFVTIYFDVNSTATIDDIGELKIVPNSLIGKDESETGGVDATGYLTTPDYVTNTDMYGSSLEDLIGTDYTQGDQSDCTLSISGSISEQVLLASSKAIFDAKDGKIVVGQEEKTTVEKKGQPGDKINAPAATEMTRFGYNFDKWKLKDSSQTLSAGGEVTLGETDVTYEAQWTAKNVSITVSDENSHNTSPKTVAYGSKSSSFGLVDGTATEDFAGWEYTNKDGNKVVVKQSDLPDLTNGNYQMDATYTITLKAIYKETVDYTFNAESSDETINGTVNGGTSYTLKLYKGEANNVTIPGVEGLPDGVTFEGWALPTSPDKVVYAAGTEEITPDAGASYVAKYSDSRITITYSYTKPGESKATETTEKLVSGKDLTLPTVNDVVGYTFKWKDAPADGKAPSKDTTITGEFTKKKYTVIWYDDDDNTVKDTSAAFEFGSDFTENAPDMSTVESFDSWEKTITKFDAETVKSATDVYTKNSKVVASTEQDAVKTENVILIKPKHKNQITVTYKDNGVTVTNGEVKGYAGRQINNIPDVPEVDGYESAWDPALTIFPTSDTTVNAKHTAKSVSVTFTDWSTSNTNKKYDEKLTDPNVSEINNKKVNGWFFKKNETTDVKFDFSKTIEQNMKDAGCNYSETLTLTAAYTVIDKYLIIDTYDFTNKKVNEYKDGGADYTVENKPGTAYYAPTAEAEEGFILTGWSTTPNGAKTIELGASMQLGDAHNTYYGVYERKQYTVDFYDGDNKYIDTQTITYGEPFARPEDPIVAEGEDPFVGWLENGTKDTFIEAYKNAAGQYIMPNKNLRFDAKYKSQWDVDSGLLIGGLVVGGAVVGGIVAVNTALITGAAVVGGTVAIIGGVHLYKHTYTVTYMVDGEVYRTFKVVNGLKVPTPKDPSKDGATFKGWDKDIPSTMPEHDLVFEAQFGNGTGIPATGSASIGIVAFAALSVATATAFVFKKKKEDEE